MEQNDRRRRGRRRYLDDFKRDETGKFVYTGDYYKYTGSVDRKKAVALVLVHAAIMAAAAMAAGFVSAAGMDNGFYVILPYALGVVAAFCTLWSAFRLFFGGDPLKTYDYETTVPRIPLRSLLSAGAAAITIIGTAVYLIINGFQGKLLGTITFMILEAVMLAFSIMLRKRFEKLSWSK